MAVWSSGSSAGRWSSGDLRNIELQSFTSSRGSHVYHVQKKQLSIKDVHSILARNDGQLHESGKKMLENLNNVKSHDFQLIQQEFAVSFLQHVTDRASMDGIYNHGGFKIINRTSRLAFRDLSFWSAGVAVEDVEAAREQSYEDIIDFLSSEMATKYEERLKAQFANSPAFDTSSSRYGNFRFSFPLFSLLDLYQAQHCGGEEPQLRILGTDMYKQEIAHYILVHSPDKSDQFRDLPMVPTVRGNSGSHFFVYRKNGKLYWRPESTSSVLTVQVSDEGIAWRECPIPCEYFNDNGYCCHIREDSYEVWSIWNHLVFAFHLPNNRSLMIPKEQLLNNLTACSIDKPALLDESKCLRIEDAEDIIQHMRTS